MGFSFFRNHCLFAGSYSISWHINQFSGFSRQISWHIDQFPSSSGQSVPESSRFSPVFSRSRQELSYLQQILRGLTSRAGPRKWARTSRKRMAWSLQHICKIDHRSGPPVRYGTLFGPDSTFNNCNITFHMSHSPGA